MTTRPMTAGRLISVKDQSETVRGMKSKSCSPIREADSSPQNGDDTKRKIAHEIAQVAKIAKQLDPYGYNEIQENIIKVVSQTNISILHEPEIIKTIFGERMSAASKSIVNFCRDKFPPDQSSSQLLNLHKALIASSMVSFQSELQKQACLLRSLPYQ